MGSFRLFCFPYAGGSSWVFRHLATHLQGRVEVVPVDLPGRGRRRAERCIDDWHELKTLLATELGPLTREPYALLGYSLGALVALGLAHELAGRRDPGVASPSALFACALRGPRAIEYRQLLHRMDDRAMFEALRELGGIPDELLGSPELIALSAPAMRADLRLFETYEPAGLPLDGVPVFAYYGIDDESVGNRFAAWGDETKTTFLARAFEGGHMFMHDSAAELGDAVVADLMAIGIQRKIA
ncbi:MAG: thioesterase [Lysobacter sp.]|nr:thioesterase [Lysobacter sp.]